MLFNLLIFEYLRVCNEIKDIAAMRINCREHRKAMELLGLQMRLKKGISDPKEKKQMEQRIERLERELEID